MKTKKWILPVCITFGVVVLCIIGLLVTAGIMSKAGYGISVGRLYLSGADFYLVDEGKAMFMSDQSDDKKLFDGLNSGDLILVVHDGVEESYPSRTGAHGVFRLSKGGENNLPRDLNIGIVELDKTADIMDAPPIEFDVQYIRTDGYHGNTRYPATKVIRSVAELKEYYGANKEKYDLERRDEVYSDSTIGFLDACDKYDDVYFEDHVLVIVLLEEGSGSNRHKVRSVQVSSSGKCYIYIDTIAPEVGTDDMAQWHILIEPKAGTEIENASDITVFVDGINPLTKPELVQYGRGYANISLKIFAGWEYKFENYEDGNDFGINFWPAGKSEGRINVRYSDMFGVCGTGLKQEKITLGAYVASKGTYGDRKVWDFIRLIGTPGDYVIMNEGADVWWSEYGDEAMQILNTLVVGDGYINEAKATTIAKKEVAVKYDSAHAYFDSETGFWTVSLYNENTRCDGHYVTMTCEGKVIDIQYGE